MVWTGDYRGTLAPALVALFDQADEGWPNRSDASDGSLGDQAHADRTSDHNPKLPNPPGWVDAADLTEDHVNGPSLPALWDHLIATRDSRVKYLIYEGRIVASYGTSAWTPRPYTGLNAHRQHIHISVTTGGRGDTSPWFPTGAAAPTALPEEDDMAQVDQATFDNMVSAINQIHGAVAEMRPKLTAVQSIAANTAWGVLDPGQGLRSMVAELAGRPVDDVDEAEVARLVLAGLGSAELSAEQVAGLIEALPKAVADELARRAQD